MANSNYPTDRKRIGWTVRLLKDVVQSGMVAEIGSQAFTIVATVALKEDALHYSRPVEIWNAELLRALNYHKDRDLKKHRDRAIKAGLLHYEPGNRSQPGKYWTMRPACLAFHSQTTATEYDEPPTPRKTELRTVDDTTLKRNANRLREACSEEERYSRRQEIWELAFIALSLGGESMLGDWIESKRDAAALRRIKYFQGCARNACKQSGWHVSELSALAPPVSELPSEAGEALQTALRRGRVPA